MSAPSLLEVQRWMKSCIQPQPREASLFAGDGILNPQGGDSGIERLSVYSGGYLARIEEALKEVCESVKHVIGGRRFHELAAAYADTYPSHDYNLSYVGRHLPDFILKSELKEKYPFLSELARLEWYVSMAFHSRGKDPVDMGSIRALTLDQWDCTVMEWQDSVRLVESEWPILDIWNARKLPVKEVNIDLINRPQKILVSRSGFGVHCEIVEPTKFYFLKGLLAGESLGHVCENVPDEYADLDMPIAAWFSDWAGRGLMTAIHHRAPAQDK